MGRLTDRTALLDSGQDISPWGLVAHTLPLLSSDSRDFDLRLALARAYVRLELKTAAAEQLELMPGPWKPEASAIGAANARLPDDRVDPARSLATCRGNVEALATNPRWPVDLRPKMNAWRMLRASQEWFAASGESGSTTIVRRAKGPCGEWVSFQDFASAAAVFTLPRQSPVPPTTLDGLDPWLLRRLHHLTTPTGDGYFPPIAALCADPVVALDALAMIDLRDVLADPRVRLIIGSDALRRLSANLGAPNRQRTAIAGPLVSAACGAPMGEGTAAALQEAARSQHAGMIALDEQVRNIYSTRSREWSARRFADALSGHAEPLRVLVPTTRYSTYIRHSAHDLAEALSAAGCETRVLIEPDEFTHLTNVAYLHEIAEFRPDLIVQINYTRANLPGLYPSQVVHAAWIQDAMPHLFSGATGAAQTPLDFIAGNLREDLFQSFGYSRTRALAAPMVASGRKFHDGPTDARQAVRHDCEIAYVSHHSETPEAMHARKSMEAGDNRTAVDLMNALQDRIREVVIRPVESGPLSTSLHSLAVGTMREFGLATDAAGVADLLNRYVHPMADRILRHQTLRWAADIAERRGWRMHIYGRGWDTHPAFAPMARGELEHGEDLRACYRTARAHLHVSLHTALHQRVFECAMSGGLPLCLLQGDDLSSMHFDAAAACCRTADADVAHPWVRLPHNARLLGWLCDRHPPGAEFAALRLDLGLQVEPAVWLNSVHVDRLRADPAGSTDAPQIARLLGEPASIFFHTPGRLESLLDRAVNDPTRRSHTRRAIVNSSSEHVTTDGFSRRLLKFITSSLASADPDSGRRWYDA